MPPIDIQEKQPFTDILGVHVSAINMPMALATIDTWVRKREQNYVCVAGVHGVMESQRDEALRQIHNAAGLVTPDGMPLVWISRWHGFSQVDRVYGPDLMLAVCQMSIEKGYRHFLYGGAQGVPELLASRLRSKIPDLQIVGTYSPPFRSLSAEEDGEVVKMINAVEPDIIWVGLSTPKQERWMAAHVGYLHASVMIGVGAAFDFHAGLKRQAPYWMQRSGLEWFFRLATEPRRLWRRYLVNNPRFVTLLLMQTLKLRRYPIP